MNIKKIAKLMCTCKEKVDFIVFVTNENAHTGDEGCECDTDNSFSIVTFLLMTTRPFCMCACLIAGGGS
jgi:hypothetical protein